MDDLFFGLISSGIKWLYFRIRYSDRKTRLLAIRKFDERAPTLGILQIVAVLFMLLIAGSLIIVVFVTVRDLFK